MSDREYLIYRLEQIAQSPLCHDSSAIREAIALMRGQSWQPIETAPKDETTILVYSPELRNAETAWWDGHGWSYNWHEYDGSSYLKSVTHWQPLPTPPEDTADEQ